MISAPSDPSTATGGESAQAGSSTGNAAGEMPSGGSAPAAASASASAPTIAEASPDQQGQQADPFAQRLHEHEASQRQQWQGAEAAPEAVQPSYSQGNADDFSEINDTDDLPF